MTQVLEPLSQISNASHARGANRAHMRRRSNAAPHDVPRRATKNAGAADYKRPTHAPACLNISPFALILLHEAIHHFKNIPKKNIFIMSATTVNVSNISANTGEKEVREFFRFVALLVGIIRWSGC